MKMGGYAHNNSGKNLFCEGLAAESKGFEHLDKHKIIIVSAAGLILSAAIIAFLTGGFGLFDGHIHDESENGNETNEERPSQTETVKPSPTPVPSPEPTVTPEPSPTPEPTPVDEYEGLKVKALYLTGSSAGDRSRMEWVIDLAKRTELNSVVIDIKDTWVNYDCGVAEVDRLNLERNMYQPEELIKELHDNDIYVIGRLVVFKDHYLATKRADLAIKSKGGGLWYENGKTAWTNPYVEEVWDYNISIALEAAKKGFDEIQFDYVRFPTDPGRKVDYGSSPPPKPDAINGFLKLAAEKLQPLGCKVSADIFGIVIESRTDGMNLGQDMESIGMNIDAVSPMIYPSHYSNDSNGAMGNGYGQEIGALLFKKPDMVPYDIVYNTLLNAKKRLSEVEGYRAVMRPYLQAFTASYLPKGYYQTYGAKQIRQQIKGVYDAGYEEWILWNARNIYPEGAFLPEDGQD